MSQYDISTGYNHTYDLFDDTMINTKTITTGITQGIYTTGLSPYTINTINGGDTLWNSTTLNTPLKVYGDAEIDGDIKIKGKSLSEAIENIEKRLAILHPNEKLEEKWEELKALGERYRELEKDILEKEEIWKILKK